MYENQRQIRLYNKIVALTPHGRAARTTAAKIAEAAGVSEGTARRYLRDAVERGNVTAARRPGYAEHFDFYRHRLHQ